MSNNNYRWFQWIAGDRKGEVVAFEKIESEDANIFLVFKDGSRINENLVSQINEKDLTGKFMAEIDSPNNLWKFKEEWVGREEEKWEQNADGIKVCVQPFVPGRKVVKLIPPKPTPPTHSVFGKIEGTIQTETPAFIKSEAEYVSNSNSKDVNDPVYILMSKSKKVDSEINMNITISLPPKNLYYIAKESFDEGEKKFVEYIIGDIEVDKIKEAIKIAIMNMYEAPDAD
jgi:hypothetical protein